MALQTSAFSTDGSEAISRQISAVPHSSVGKNLREYYEIDRCLRFIASFRKVALQFPDQLLCDSVAVTTILAGESGRECVILGDTSYGSCCVDEVAASHVDADCIIHFGPSCLTQTERLPVLYVFGREEVKMEECERAFRELFPDPMTSVLILYDTVYHHCIAELMERLSDYVDCTPSLLSLPHPITPSPSTEATPTQDSCIASDGDQLRDSDTKSSDLINAPSPSGVLLPTSAVGPANSSIRFGRSFKLDKPVTDVRMFYIGREGRTLTNLLISYSRSQFYSYDPESGERRRESSAVNKALGKRYYLVQKAKEARTVGILVGTLGAAGSMEVMQRLKSLLRQAGKKYYTVAVGKLNVAKMANFMEIDVFVLVACPRTASWSLRTREWSGEVITDYRELFSLPVLEDRPTEDEEEEPEFSLISGGLLPSRHPRDSEREGEEGAVALRASMDVALPNSTGAEFLRGRGWKGLERRLGEGGVATANEGRRGVASAYSHENYTQQIKAEFSNSVTQL
ncbi:2-(3-amino-3-carboxypropyl)histidine synthase subunit 2 [Geodia barretti]|uniref:2-(3-amino-3-carboxypropyl)histidine synthase subunit 2 n=1 Tax=Geodia barretti TaxID=519541 RepID=A0AA35WIW0_GEOBA|nr:2-(3-amino-3-carboxypropyl)histidine synthase subunit 2 [Geodia barretti]